MFSGLTLVVSVLVFGVVILVHEFGHFITAKKCGIQVNEFSIGMGPLVLGTRRRGTQYSLRLLPIGGYVAMEGENSPESADEEDDNEEKPERPLLFRRRWDTMVAAEAVQEAPPKGIPLNEAARWKRFIIMVAGAVMNFLLGYLLLVILVSNQNYLISRQISYLEEGALSGQTGLQVDDVVERVNGHYCFVANDIIYELSRAEDHRAAITVRRDGKKVLLPDVQFDVVQNEDGTETMQMGFKVYGVEKTPMRVLYQSLRYTGYYGSLIITSLTDLFAGRASVNDLSGPVGIVSAIGEAVGYGWLDVVSLAALITVNLGIFNLLPLPALDGGKALLTIVEAIIRRDIPAKIQFALNAAGMIGLLLLMIFATFQDILRLM